MSGVVAAASPLIAFAQIGHLPLLQALFTTLLAPSAVAREIAPSVPRQPWIVERQPTQPLAPQVLQATLGAGESAGFIGRSDRRERSEPRGNRRAGCHQSLCWAPASSAVFDRQLGKRETNA